MSSGTITVTNKSDKVVGVGTAFTTDLKAGDVMVMPVGTWSFTLIVKSIESATGLTLMEPFRGPTLSGQSWSAVPYETMLRINAQLSTQTSVAIYGLNLDKQNWQAVFSESGDITITLPDLTTFTGPSWKKIAELLEAIDEPALQALATQIHNDSAQVATDKTIATQAAVTATQAKTDAQTAQGLAEAAATGSSSSESAAAQHASDAEGDAAAAAESATEAANYAASINPEYLLHKDQNLNDLADKSAARGNLGVYSKYETDAKNTATNARIGYALLSPTTKISVLQRIVLGNPFGNNTPVLVQAELLSSDGKWFNTGWAYNGSNNVSYGINASYSEGEGIVVQAGSAKLNTDALNAGGGAGPMAEITTGNYRVLVYKVTA